MTDPDSLTPEVQERLDRIWAQAYDARGTGDLERLYANWAASYDEDHEAIGFEGHFTAASLLERYVPNPAVRPVLDAGAGTGAAGVALKQLGFENVTAVDLSQAMLDVAAKKDLYVQLFQADLGEPLDMFPRSHFHAAILVGVFSYGQAPAHAFDEILRIVEPGGVVVFTARTDFWEEDAMGVRSRAEFLERDGRWRRLDVTDPAPYLPKKDPNAMFRAFAYRVLEADAPINKDAFCDAVREAVATNEGVLRLDHAFIWNATGSRLYNRYTHRVEYYLTDCEEEILREHADEIVGDSPELVELGCGSARKINHLLAAVVEGQQRSVRYVPVDVSDGALQSTCDEVQMRFGDAVAMQPEHGMFDDVLERLSADDRKVVLFFGSSMGNFETIGETIDFLRHLRDRLSPEDRFVVGVDLHKAERDVLAAYSAGEENLSFFMNMVRRINDDLGGTFDLTQFDLGSTYSEEPEVIEGLRSWCVDFRVVTRERQYVYVRDVDLEFDLPAGSAVQVGTSRKYRPEDIRKLAEAAGLRVSRQWFDAKKFFSLNEMVRDDAR